MNKVNVLGEKMISKIAFWMLIVGAGLATIGILVGTNYHAYSPQAYFSLVSGFVLVLVANVIYLGHDLYKVYWKS